MSLLDPVPRYTVFAFFGTFAWRCWIKELINDSSGLEGEKGDPEEAHEVTLVRFPDMLRDVLRVLRFPNSLTVIKMGNTIRPYSPRSRSRQERFPLESYLLIKVFCRDRDYLALFDVDQRQAADPIPYSASSISIPAQGGQPSADDLGGGVVRAGFALAPANSISVLPA